MLEANRYPVVDVSSHCVAVDDSTTVTGSVDVFVPYIPSSVKLVYVFF